MSGREELFIDGKWLKGKGDGFVSLDPSTAEPVWKGREADQEQVLLAAHAAQKCQEKWQKTTYKHKIEVLQRFSDLLNSEKELMAETISREMGKPKWESLQEVSAMAGKLKVSMDAYKCRYPSLYKKTGSVESITRYKPQGVVAVFGPFNLPGHLPNGHIIPALLAGNTIVFKPSEQTPMTGQMMIQLWQRSGLPDGVINLIQGGVNTGKALASVPQLKGLFFTGSVGAGLSLHRMFAGKPEVLLALEMGGNNPLICWDADAVAAAYLIVQSAFITSGQRCVCARRLIIPKGKHGEEILYHLVKLVDGLKVGPWAGRPEPFMGPVISSRASETLLRSVQELIKRGAKEIIGMKPTPPAFLTPGILNVTEVSNRPDEELFGPLLQVIRVDKFDDAVEEANNTRFGLAAGLISKDEKYYDFFRNKSRAGIVNWNRQITGASSSAPFGGSGLSGNHRPGAFFAADYCAYPVASLETNSLSVPDNPLPGLPDYNGIK